MYIKLCQPPKSFASIKRLQKEKVDIGGAAFLTPTKRYRHSRCLLVNDFDHEAIRRIYHLYQAKVHVTLAELLVVLKEDNSFAVRGQPFTFC